jgi:hypothetical protein
MSYSSRLLWLQSSVLLVFAVNALPVAAASLFINDATVHPVTSPMLPKADIVITDGRVAAVGANLTAPENATVIEAHGRPVTPALFAGITALGLEEISGEITSVDQSLQWDPLQNTNRLRPEFDVAPAFNPHSVAIPVTRIEGYGWTLLGAERFSSIIGGRGRAVSLDGAYQNFLSDPVLFIGMGAAGSLLSGQSRAAQFMLLDQAMEESRSAMAWTPDALLTAAGRRTLAGYSGNGIVVFNVHRASDIRQVLQLAHRHQFDAVIQGGDEAWMVAGQLAEAGVPVILDPLSNLPSDFDSIGARLDNAALLHQAGVSISFSMSGDATHNARKLRYAAGVAVANGLPFAAGLEALTINPASIFNLPEGYGSIAANAPANLVMWTGDPLEVTTLADAVILNGKNIPLVSRQTLLRDRYLPQNPALPRAYIKK